MSSHTRHYFLAGSCMKAHNDSMLRHRYPMRPSDIPRKLLAVVALLTLLAASTPAFAEALSASNSLACCNTAYCPVHHRQSRDLQKDKSNCDSHGKTGAPDCSMRACDSAPNQAVGTTPFTLAAPITIFYEATAQPAPLSLSGLVPYVFSLPSTPPPRLLPS
jgi:hypothetical protein